MRRKLSVARRREPRRLLRSKRAVASAIATMFVLLIVVLMFSEYISTTFPVQMQNAEFNHDLLVENQFDELQANIQSEISHPNLKVPITTPISMSGVGVPPLGPPAGSTLASSYGSLDNVTFGITTLSGHASPPIWNTSTCWCDSCSGGVPNWQACTSGASNACALTSNVINYNISYTDLEGHPWLVSGSGDCNYINVSGSHDDLKISLSGGHEVSNVIVIQGNYDDIDLVIGGRASEGTTVELFGEHNTYNLTAVGSNLDVNTLLIGYAPGATSCPWQAGASSDAYNILAPGGTNVDQNVTWYYQTPPPASSSFQQVLLPGSAHGSNDYLGTQNITGPNTIGCAFTGEVANTYQEAYIGGLEDALNNVYQAPITLSYEEGAVLVGNAGGSTMLSGPQISVLNSASGAASVSLTFVQFQPKNLTTERGSGVVGVETWLISESTVSFTGSSGTGQSQSLLISTFYPQAWISWAGKYPSVFQSGGTSSCHAYGGGLPVCSVQIPVTDSSLTITSATVGITDTA